MLVFPQLSTGAAAVYPLSRARSRRTVQNVLEDGSTIRFGDPDFTGQGWEIAAAGLTRVEWEAIEDLFRATAGRLSTFTFLEPAGNLLAESENFVSPRWDNSALISITTGIDDPWGGIRGSHLANVGPSPGDMRQTLPVPGNFRYTLSVWGRASGANSITLFAETLGGATEREFGLNDTWQRIILPVALQAESESVHVGARIAAGGSIDLCGMQVDGQPGAGDYEKTSSRGGVYPEARFATDELTVRARGMDIFDATIRILSKGN